MKKSKLKQCAECKNEFIPFLSTDKYCSLYCAFKNKKSDKPRKAIRKISKKKASQNLVYSSLRRVFLESPENRYCPVVAQIYDRSVRTTEVHHKAGRVGKLYLDTSKWLAVSRKGHNWIHDNPKLAYDKGWLIKSTTI